MVWNKSLGHRSVKEVKVFCGWPTLRKLSGNCDETSRLLVLSLFKTGGRISEVLTLNREQCDYVGNYFDVIDMPVHKRHLSYVPTRTVPILISEPLTEEWISVLPEQGRFFKFKYAKAYKIVRELQRPLDKPHGPWYPHRFRAERARQLVRDYGFDALLLKQFFSMARIDTPIHYASPELAAVKSKMVR